MAKFPKILQIGAILALALDSTHAHSYHLGDCPVIEPMANFEPKKMLGMWYVIQQTNTGRICITYNFSTTDQPYQYHLERNSVHYVLGITPIRRQESYNGDLIVPDGSPNAQTVTKFPWNMIGSENYTVFMADYEHYAGIFTCQKYGFGHRQSAMILSRQKTLDQGYLDKIRQKLAQANIDPFELSTIDQQNCPKDSSTIKIVINALEKTGQSIRNTIDNVISDGKDLNDKVVEHFETTASGP